MVKLSAAFFHDESSITKGGHEIAIAPRMSSFSEFATKPDCCGCSITAGMECIYISLMLSNKLGIKI